MVDAVLAGSQAFIHHSDGTAARQPLRLWAARRARRDDLHRAVDAGEPGEGGPVGIVEVGVAAAGGIVSGGE
jgi:hypothetical protein